jgi:uncharacterized protein (TIGR02172 family)
LAEVRCKDGEIDLEVKKKKELHEISIDGCRKIGEGAHGVVYQTAPDMLVKVYREGVSLDDIHREQALCRRAFVKGIPTAIPFGVVRVGGHYGTMFELLNAKSASDYIAEFPERLDWFIEKSVELMKQVHAIEAESGELPDMKQQTVVWLEKIRTKLSSVHYEKLRQILESVPDRRTLLHADFHLKNIMVCGDELMLIDMDTLCTGDPIFELATVYNSYREFPSINPAAAAFLGIDVKTAERICDRTFELYLEGDKTSSIQNAVHTARLLGCIRIIEYMDRNARPESEQCIEHCCRDIEMLLDIKN